MITVKANARSASYDSDDLITSGSAGIPCEFVLSSDFNGLSPIAVFEGSGTARDVALIGDSCVVPHEVLTTAGGYLRIGIYASNSAGTIVIPTVWAGSKMILQGTEPSEVDPSAPTPSWVAQVQAAAAEAVQTSEEAIEIAGGAQAAADDARESASAAAGSATAAAQSESAASGYATSASGSASAAAQSATGAAGSASNAASSASAAAGSATAAATSADAAAAAEAAAREVEESIPADYTELSEDVSELKSQTPSVMDSTKTGVDLDITDALGNVILRLAHGHVQTREFDSRDTVTNADLEESKRIRSRMEFGAHNGAEYYAPECTVPAYRIAGQQGWEWAWVAGIDFSTDGTMYVIHDDTVDRTTDGTGYINQMTDAQINALNITQTGPGYDLSEFDPAELKIPTFEQVLQQCVRYGMKMVLRLHLFPGENTSADGAAKWGTLVDLLKGYNVQSSDISCYVGGLSWANVCRSLFGEDVEISTFLGSAATAQDFVTWFSERSITGNRAAIIYGPNVDLAAVKLLHSNGIRVYAYQYNPPESVVANFAQWGVDILQNGKTYKIAD